MMMNTSYVLNLMITAEGHEREDFVCAFHKVFAGFPKDNVWNLANGDDFNIIGEDPAKAIAWWLRSRGFEPVITKVTTEIIHLEQLGYMKV